MTDPGWTPRRFDERTKPRHSNRRALLKTFVETRLLSTRPARLGKSCRRLQPLDSLSYDGSLDPYFRRLAATAASGRVGRANQCGIVKCAPRWGCGLTAAGDCPWC